MCGVAQHVYCTLLSSIRGCAHTTTTCIPQALVPDIHLRIHIHIHTHRQSGAAALLCWPCGQERDSTQCAGDVASIVIQPGETPHVCVAAHPSTSIGSHVAAAKLKPSAKPVQRFDHHRRLLTAPPKVRDPPSSRAKVSVPSHPISCRLGCFTATCLHVPFPLFSLQRLAMARQGAFVVHASYPSIHESRDVICVLLVIVLAFEKAKELYP